MESETTPQIEEVREEKHYGRGVAVAITAILAGFVVWYGVTGRLTDFGKVSVDLSSKEQTQSENMPLPEAPKSPTEQFIITDFKNTEDGQKENIATTDPSLLVAPVNFKSFSYDANAGKTISISGNCNDRYYTLLVFESSDDYRKDPGMARANRAFECPGTKLFNVEMNLKDINLQSGSYYVFIADQGSTGGWYNPR